MKKIQSAVRRALTDFSMINDGDVIAVGVSGGKDSLVLLAALAAMRRYLPQKFELKALMLNMGFDGWDSSEIARFCDLTDVPFYTKDTEIAKVIFDIRKESNPCSLCAKMRRGALNEFAVGMGCNKVALGHHFDDVIETFFLSLLYEARLSCFDAVCYLDRVNVTVIRPLIYVKEHEIKSYVKRTNLPVMFNPCPADGYTKREDMKQMLAEFERGNRDAKERIFRAVKEGLLMKGKTGTDA